MPRGILDAYLTGGARAFFGAHFADAADRRRAVLRAVRPLAPPVADALEAQNACLGDSPAREAHLAALRRGAAAVVTGQQVGLFLGPLFTLYKAASAVAAARALAVESGRTVVPVFWLQTEDHDLPEIAACHVPCAHGPPLALRLPAAPGDRRSVAHRTLPAGVTDCLTQLRGALHQLPDAEAHLARLARHYRPDAGWGEAFAGVLAELFADDGLVLLEPRDPALAPAAAPVHQRAVRDAGVIATALVERARELEAAGFAPAVHIRPGAPLSFFHPQGATGPRYRLVPAPGGLAEVGGECVHHPADVLAADPRCFSTSALLRPVVQDTLLPTAAYVAGPAEVAYFAQLAPLYAAYDLPVPLVVPRARFRLLEDVALRLLARLRLQPDDAARPEGDLLAACAGDCDLVDRVRSLSASFDTALADLGDRLAPAGAGMPSALEKTRGTVRTALARLAERAARASAHRDERLVDDVRRLKLLLHPGDVPQERFYGLPWFAARYGERAFVARVLDAIAPFDPAPRDLRL